MIIDTVYNICMILSAEKPMKIKIPDAMAHMATLSETIWNLMDQSWGSSDEKYAEEGNESWIHELKEQIAETNYRLSQYGMGSKLMNNT